MTVYSYRLDEVQFDESNKVPTAEVYLKDVVDSSVSYAIGLPKKAGMVHTLYDYERLLLNALEGSKHVWVKKAFVGANDFSLFYWFLFKY